MLKNSFIVFVTLAFVTLCFTTEAQSANKPFKPKHSKNFSTSKDLAASVSESNFKLKNTGASAATVYGLYVRQFSYVAEGEPCTSATVMYPSTDNIAAGAMVMPVTLEANAEAAVGENYLYNMIYNATYYLRIVEPISPPGCALPGCTWGEDSTVYNWCIYVGAIAPVSVTGAYTAKVVPSSSALSGGDYNYDLISSYDYIGPISCNDLTLTCSVTSSQTQSF
ncbi:hypothetical protein K1X76_08235 [bacterium]|nr:hypothetical protein [bacterium]